MTQKYKLVYREYGQEIIIVANDEEPLLLLLRQLITKEPDFDLQFYGKEELLFREDFVKKVEDELEPERDES